jgi:hypothetical protein
MHLCSPAPTNVERCSTRDLRIPLYAGDDDCCYGRQNIPMPPAPRPDDLEWTEWVVFDDRSDKKTVWQRTRRMKNKPPI